MIHYIADDLGINRSYVGGESTTAVTRQSWTVADEAAMFAQLSVWLTAEAAMDEWDAA